MEILVLLASTVSTATASHNRFRDWQPQWSDKFSGILRNNCSAEYAAYLADDLRELDSRTCARTVSCLLSNTDERTKAVLSSAAVMLGLIPVILALVGPSIAECALLAARKPLLAFLLSLGSPSKNPTRVIEYRGPVEEIIKERHGKLKFHNNMSRGMNAFVAIIEIVLAAGSVWNVLYLCWKVGKTTVFNPWCEQSWGPLVWVMVAAVIYLLGTGTFFSVLRRHWISEKKATGIQQVIWKSLKNELSPCRAQAQLHVGWKPESYIFVFLGWATTMLTILHIMFGTFWFSSLLFVSAADALGITGRFMVSAVICRLVLKYELAGMRETTELKGKVLTVILRSYVMM
ncbi:hypothetical protein VTL71DRAFT_9040 [Oculimacula yallundae]|uniref:Uncharacterized protein n=1 Tax=Oculimacula yallundae TaxID=86028 RepID=A0ABR4BTL1_9HELO